MASDYSYQVFIDTTGFGHAFIGIYGPNGESEVWGYYPGDWYAAFPESSGGEIIIGPGKLQRDDEWFDEYPETNGMHPYDYSTGKMPITKENYDAMNAHIKATEENPGTWAVFNNNCVQFVEDMMRIAGDRPPTDDVTAPLQLKLQLILRKQFIDFFDNIKDFYGIAKTTPLPRRSDPLIFDLDGDGIETIGVKDGAYFDHDGNGFAEKTGWASSDDGLLVFDRNADGIINDGKELFGDQTILKNGRKAANGFEALAELDDNGDGKIDANDAAYSQLRIWQDINGDGYSSIMSNNNLFKTVLFNQRQYVDLR